MSGNEFLVAARQKKVTAMVMYFDVWLPRTHNIDPLQQPDKAVDKLRAIAEEDWARHAILAGQRKPSLETRAEIYAVYERRGFELEAGIEHLAFPKAQAN